MRKTREVAISVHRGDTFFEPRLRPLYAPGGRTVTVAAYVAEAPDGWEPVLDHEHDQYR
ncbi:MAG TPA: hypothetical protein VFC31_06610 [Candidatus Limnocylindria bacterium]|nr:hypothetical protein [Candidatus Limnocylindria bacterium]